MFCCIRHKTTSDGLTQGRRNSIASALELRPAYINPSKLDRDNESKNMICIYTGIGRRTISNMNSKHHSRAPCLRFFLSISRYTSSNG